MLKKCINNKNNCYCNDLRECNKCNGNNIKDGKCVINSEDFCTCRLCGNAVRSDGYRCKEYKKL
jgi:hypothetical protein